MGKRVSEMSDHEREHKRRLDRERLAKKRAAMTPEERAARRAEDDRLYRERHRQERRDYDQKRLKAKARAKWAAPEQGGSPAPDAS